MTCVKKRGFSVIIAIAMFIMTLSCPGISASETNQQNSDTIMQKISTNLNSRTEKNLIKGSAPCRGESHLLIVDLILEGSENQLSADEMTELFFGDHYTDGSPARDENLTDYFENISYGRLHLTGKVFPYEVKSLENLENQTSAIVDEILKNEEISWFDANNDTYFDGIIFYCPDELDFNGGYAGFWDYSNQTLHSSSYVYLSAGYKTVHTLAHEVVHTMGLPDIYANVSLNPAGTTSCTLMDGGSSEYSYENGCINYNIPGIMKFFFGWIDDLTEISETGSYSIESFSQSPSAAVIYPEGNTDSRFVFWVEYLTPDNNDRVYDGYDYFGTGGLRIWKVLLNVDENYNIKGNHEAIGCGKSPYLYLEAVNKGDESPFIFSPGTSFSADTNPCNDYFTKIELKKYYSEISNYTYNSSLPADSYKSGFSIDEYSVTGKTAVLPVTFSEDKMEVPVVEQVCRNDDTVNIRWKTVSNCEGYYVYRKAVSSLYEPYEKIAEISGSDSDSYTDILKDGEKKYIYTVEAFSLKGTSGYDSGYSDVLLISATNFPDDNFRSYVRSFDTDNDSVLHFDEIESVKEIDVKNFGIKNLKGIEYFTYLESLDCSNNSLLGVDISKNTSLKSFECENNSFSVGNIGDSLLLSELPDFDVSRVTEWIGADYNPETDTLNNFRDKTITYRYNCGNDVIKTFRLYADSCTIVTEPPVTVTTTVPVTTAVTVNTTTATSPVTTAAVSEVSRGDLNRDGNINAADVVVIQKYVIMAKTGYDVSEDSADMNKDGCVNVFDVVLLKRIVLSDVLM